MGKRKKAAAMPAATLGSGPVQARDLAQAGGDRDDALIFSNPFDESNTGPARAKSALGQSPLESSGSRETTFEYLLSVVSGVLLSLRR